MAAYATVAQFEDYVEGWVTDDEAALERYLERATLEVDLLLGPWPRDSETGLKVIPAELYGWQADALARATCAQAEYLIEVGPAGRVRPQASRIAGPDFTVEYDLAAGGPAPRLGPKVAGELEPLRALLRPAPVRARP